MFAAHVNRSVPPLRPSGGRTQDLTFMHQDEKQDERSTVDEHLDSENIED